MAYSESTIYYMEAFMDVYIRRTQFVYKLLEAHNNSVLYADYPIILVCGNGGSSAQADHLVAELMGSFNGNDKIIPAISLSNNTALLTATANDCGYSESFLLGVKAFGRPRSVFLAISTSGESLNVLKACEEASNRGMVTFAITNSRESTLSNKADFTYPIKGDTQKIQEKTLETIHQLAKGLKDGRSL